MSVTKRRLVIFGTVALAVVATALVITGKPVLLRVPHTENQLLGGHNFVLFNPFRDRSPERAAASYLDAMRRGDCPEARKKGANPSLPNDVTCEQLQQESGKYRQLFVQPLRDREDRNGDVLLYYSRTGYEGNWIVMRSVGGEWRVVGFTKVW